MPENWKSVGNLLALLVLVAAFVLMLVGTPIGAPWVWILLGMLAAAVLLK